MNRIVTKIFGGAGIDEQGTGLHCRFNEAEHCVQIVLRNYLGKHFAALANTQRNDGRLLARSLTAGL